MNKDRRKALQNAIARMDDIKADINEVKELIEIAKDEEQEYFDNMPEAFQQGEKGQAAEAAVSELDEAISELESAIDHISNAQG